MPKDDYFLKKYTLNFLFGFFGICVYDNKVDLLYSRME
jgi:hypothetical protein